MEIGNPIDDISSRKACIYLFLMNFPISKLVTINVDNYQKYFCKIMFTNQQRLFFFFEKLPSALLQ